MYTSATRWSLASWLTFATVPSTTRSIASLLVAMTRCASCARFVALREVRLATKCNASSTHKANNGARCGSPSWRTVASQYVSASARRPRASAHGVGVVSPARYGCSAAGAFSAIAYLLQLCRSRYVLVEPEDVCGVVAALDLNEPLPGRARVGRADSRFALVAEEVDVHARVALLQRRREPRDPVLVLRGLLSAFIYRAEGDHDPASPVGEGGSLDGYAGHRPTQHPELGHGHRRTRGLEVLDDRLRRVSVEGVYEQRARHLRIRTRTHRLVHLWVRLPPHSVDQRGGERPQTAGKPPAPLHPP